MSCYHPLYGIPIEGSVTKNGKQNLKILRAGEESKYPQDKLVRIPCGKCIGCRLEYSRQWANRCMLELQYHDSAYFVTFTYDDAHIPLDYSVDPKTGEAFPVMTLRKRDWQLAMKRIRRRFENDRIRFFMAGEYGSSTYRPHYHAILFGLHLNDCELYSRTPRGDNLFTSASLSSCWCDSTDAPLGFVVVAPVTWETCAYVARYTAKKNGCNDNGVYEQLGMLPPFTLMSRRPGIGREYYDTHPDLYKYEFINVSTPDGGRKFRPPKYFDRLHEIDAPDEMEQLKEVRRNMAKSIEDIKKSRTNLDNHSRDLLAERVKAGQAKSLQRKLQ